MFKVYTINKEIKSKGTTILLLFVSVGKEFEADNNKKRVNQNDRVLKTMSKYFCLIKSLTYNHPRKGKTKRYTRSLWTRASHMSVPLCHPLSRSQVVETDPCRMLSQTRLINSWRRHCVRCIGHPYDIHSLWWPSDLRRTNIHNMGQLRADLHLVLKTYRENTAVFSTPNSVISVKLWQGKKLLD